MGATRCTVHGCSRAPHADGDRCPAHRMRKQCSIHGCVNVVYARQLCVRHGGKKQCQVDGCGAAAQGGDVCAAHGGEVVKRFCRVDGCMRQSHARRLCVHHGGGRRCQHTGCPHHARAGGFCHKHKNAAKTPLPPLRISMSSPQSTTTTDTSSVSSASPPSTPLAPCHSPPPPPSNAAFAEWWELTHAILHDQYPWLHPSPHRAAAARPPVPDARMCLQLTQAVLLTPTARDLLAKRLLVLPAPRGRPTAVAISQIDLDIGGLASLFSTPPHVATASTTKAMSLSDVLHASPVVGPASRHMLLNHPPSSFHPFSFVDALGDFSILS
ncbi:Aste57867_19338 [Aphanomyces stellatus]|uniref:Aste57867_19338 protein n=1 Tax=Aphanomyces stellatus TaxID=120398 RepID=A0A485LC95_9STRA|nr:hypothetical protein As57867_019274 [Aphanomyces stellatus]VFT96053.1 Aste57867_19338 [Aphanomyces stellatus]